MFSINDDAHKALKVIQCYQAPFINAKESYNMPYKSILLTGANGYLGVHLINELIEKTDAIIYCGIRGDTLNNATEKLNDSFMVYNFSQYIGHKRLKVVLIDISKEQIGLSNKKWKLFASSLDAIYHNGAYVHHLQTFERMQPTNVASTEEIIKLAAEVKVKRIHFISTKYACINGIEDVGHEGMPSIAPLHQDLSFGYTNTKWASEWLLWKAKENGIPVDIYRLGQITGNSKTGISNYKNNNLTKFIIGCIDMGYAPNLQHQHEMIPVDIIAKSIIALSIQHYKNATAWNIVNDNQIAHADIFTIMQGFGYDIEIINNNDWRVYLRKITEKNPLFPLISYYDNEENIKFIRIENSIAMSHLKKLDIYIPEDYKKLFKIYINYWREQGLSVKL